MQLFILIGGKLLALHPLVEHMWFLCAQLTIDPAAVGQGEQPCSILTLPTAAA